MGIHQILHSSCWFLNINTAIMRRLIRTARTLEAEWWQVCREAWVRGQRKMSLGCWISPCYGPFSLGGAFWNLWTIYFFNFSIFFFQAVVNRGYWILGYGGPPLFSNLHIRKCVLKFIWNFRVNINRNNLALRHIMILACISAARYAHSYTFTLLCFYVSWNEKCAF